MSDQPILEMRDVTKTFTGIDALRSVGLEVYPGEVHCLLGDNGAGKSTLIKILSGVHRPTSGQVLVDGKPVSFADPRESRSQGIATVHQDIGMVPMMSVARNFFLGAELTKGSGPLRRMDLKKSGEIAVQALRDLGITRVHSGAQLTGSLSGGERQSVAICRALHFGARILILDEATSALGVREAAIVLRSVARAKARGIGVVFITHNAQHALSIGDRFTVLIHGQVAASFRRGEKTSAELLDLMAGGHEMAELSAELENLGVTMGSALEERPHG
jgi:simple sugar transport system ATP-binding protein